jgi:hypothetical protein
VTRSRILSLLLATGASCGLTQATDLKTTCAFDMKTLSFVGTPQQQVHCLLRRVLPGGEIAASPDESISGIEARVGESVGIDKALLRNWLRSREIDEADVGGDLDEPLSKVTDVIPSSIPYFVIHDTSTPNLVRAPFPNNMNTSGWKWNQRSRWENEAFCHLYITRDGNSIAPRGRTFLLALHATQFENRVGAKLTGRFLHVELVQPRQCSPNLAVCCTTGQDGKKHCNDRIAPDPGFSQSQLERLALAYVCASVRAGVWLIPTFHAVLDGSGVGTHDDPQMFDLAEWLRQLESTLKRIQGS